MSDRTFANSETVQTVGRDNGSAALGGDWLAVVDVKFPEVGARKVDPSKVEQHRRSPVAES